MKAPALLAIVASFAACVCVEAAALSGRYWANTAAGTGNRVGDCFRFDQNIDFNWPADSHQRFFSETKRNLNASKVCGSVRSDYFTAKWTGTITPQESDLYTFSVTTNGGVRLWVDDHLLIDNWCMPHQCWNQFSETYPSQPKHTLPGVTLVPSHAPPTVLNAQTIGEMSSFDSNPSAPVVLPAFVNITLNSSQQHFFRLDFLYASGSSVIYHDDFNENDFPGLSSSSESDDSSIILQLYWQGSNSSTPQIVPSSSFSPQMPALQQTREKMYAAQAQGWGTWKNQNMMSFVKLPEALSFDLTLYQLSHDNLLGNVHVFTQFSPATVRPGPHAYDNSYTELNVAWNDVNATIQSAILPTGDLAVVVSAVFANHSTSTDYFLIVTPSVAWNRTAGLKVSGTAGPAFVTATFPGFDGINAFFTAPANNQPNWNISAPYLGFALNQGPVGFSTGTATSLQYLQSVIKTQRTKTEAQKEVYGELADQYDAMQTVLAWNTIFEPREGVVTPVSRNWDFGFGYVLFDWDNYFCSFMCALDNKNLSYSNIIQLTKGKTMQGFVPNYISGQYASRDRTEPYVGAQVLLQIYKKHNESWIVEFLFNDLMDWNTWAWNSRREAPGLIVLGTDPNLPIQSGSVDQMQAARWESGLDNSPIYDQPPINFNATSHHMLMYDIGMIGTFLGECQALYELAGVIGDSQSAQIVQERYTEMTDLVQKYLWSDEYGIFANVQSDTGALVPHFAPTSFFPLASGVASVEQAEIMVNRHLTNVSEFCVSEDCPGFAVPSIARNDAAYRDQDYWRGRVWGPHNMLVYWGLSHPAYSESQVVTAARKQLVKQASALLLQEWYEHRHVHENFNGDTGAGDDTNSSDPFYHWGALNGFIAFLEAGYFS